MKLLANFNPSQWVLMVLALQACICSYSTGQEAVLPDQNIMEPEPFPLKRFGKEVSVFDRTLAVVSGKQGERNIVYVYEREPDSKTWELVGPLERPGPPVGDDFIGTVKVFSNDTIFVAANDQSYTDCGEATCERTGVYVYEKIEGIWKPTQFIYPDPVSDFFYVGSELEVAGKTFFMSAPRALSDSDGEKGAVFAFEKVESQWVQTKTIAGDDSDRGFGAYMGAQGDTLVVLDHPDTIYVFERNAGGPENWGQVKVFRGDELGDFGYDTTTVGAVWGDVLALYLKSEGSGPDQAAIHYRNEGGEGNWGETHRINLDLPGYPGSSQRMLLSKDTLFVSKQNFDIPDMIPIYSFERNTGGTDNWGLVRSFTPEANRYAEFQRILRIDVHNGILVYSNDNRQNDTGEVYSYIPDSALAYGLWVDAWKDPVSGSRFTGIGWLDDADWPYVFLYKDAQWLYILEEFSSLNNFFGYHMGKGSWVWSADNYGGWYYRYADQLWDQF